MQPGYLSPAECFRFVAMICAQHDCVLEDLDFTGHVLRISGPPALAAACAQTLEKWLGRFTGGILVLDRTFRVEGTRAAERVVSLSTEAESGY